MKYILRMLPLLLALFMLAACTDQEQYETQAEFNEAEQRVEAQMEALEENLENLRARTAEAQENANEELANEYNQIAADLEQRKQALEANYENLRTRASTNWTEAQAEWEGFENDLNQLANEAQTSLQSLGERLEAGMENVEEEVENG